MAASSNPEHLAWEKTTVQGRDALFGVAGSGSPVVFLHGWSLGYRSYKRALKRLVRMGLRVYAPALPGFGGTPDLPGEEFSMVGYARWVADFIRALEIDEPVTLIGHSFGGGVAICTAHNHPELVRRLVIINSIGGSAWAHTGSTIKSMAERPLWDWGIHFPADILPLRQVRRVLPVILEDALPNIIRNPRAIIRVAGLARRADLTAELEALKQRQLPVVILWGEGDKVIPKVAMESIREALGAGTRSTITVSGSHAWLLADPAAFGEVMTNVVGVVDAVSSLGNGKVTEIEELAPVDDKRLIDTA